MLAFMKYRADPSKNKSGNGCEEAQHALSLYASLDKDGKTKFLKSYEKHGKDITWVTNFKHDIGIERKTMNSVTEGWMHRTGLTKHATLQMCGHNVVVAN